MRLQHMKKWLCAAAFVLCLAPAVRAEEEPARVVRVGYFRSGSYVQQEADGTVSGYGPDYLSAVKEHTGWEFEYVYGTWPELLEKLSRREIDLVGAVQRGGPREDELEFCRYASGSEIFYLYGRLDTELYYNDYEAFDGRTVALVAGSRQDAVLDWLRRINE